MASAPSALRSRTTQDWRFFAADAGGWSPQSASASSSALTGRPGRLARAWRMTRSRGPRRPEPSTVSGPSTVMPTSSRFRLSEAVVNGADTEQIPERYRAPPGRYRGLPDLCPSGHSALRDPQEQDMNTNQYSISATRVAGGGPRPPPGRPPSPPSPRSLAVPATAGPRSRTPTPAPAPASAPAWRASYTVISHPCFMVRPRWNVALDGPQPVCRTGRADRRPDRARESDPGPWHRLDRAVTVGP